MVLGKWKWLMNISKGSKSTECPSWVQGTSLLWKGLGEDMAQGLKDNGDERNGVAPVYAKVSQETS